MTSQINANNIDGNYPVAGQPNSTEGMRTNFTNTKTNFQYAADEITELQNNSVLKAALTGTTLDNNMNDNLIYAVKLQDVSYTWLQNTTTSGTVTVDYSAGQYQYLSPTGSITLSFTNWPTAGSAGSCKISVNVTNVAYTMTLPSAVNIGNAVIPGINTLTNVITFPGTGIYVYEFETTDGGASISIENTIAPLDNFSDQVVISNTTPSTSTITGALTVAGGVGVAGNVYAGRFYGDGSYLSNIYPNYLFNGNSYMGFGTANGNANISVDGTSNVVVVSTAGQYVTGLLSVTGNIVTPTGNIIINGGTGKIGYANGAGGTVAQSGNKSGGVTLNKQSGEITMQNTNLAADTTVNFLLTNSTIAATDLLVINQTSTANSGGYVFNAICGAGNANIAVRNIMAATAGDAIVLRFAVVKGATV